MRHPDLGIERKVAVVGCKHTTRDFIVGLERFGYSIDHCLTITPDLAESGKVAGYMDLGSFLEKRSIPFTQAKRYDLKSEEDERATKSLGLDMLLVIGWQRLIPEYLLSSLSIGAFGMHGSSKPLPHGRGRSPMNWSMIQNKDIFYTHLFQYLPGVDDGPIVGVKTFDLTPFDTALSAHFKNQVAMVQLCAEHLPDLLAGRAKLKPQPKEGASYYPRRTAEDGLVDWNKSTLEIHNLVRAVTRPFPGAYTFLDNDPKQKLMIWRAIPFDTRLRWPGAIPGQIVEVFHGKYFVVKTNDSTLLVQESEGPSVTDRDVGSKLGCGGQVIKVWDGLPD